MSKALRIECNWCSNEDFVFSDKGVDTPEGGWLQRAANHLVAYHKNRLGIS